MGSATERQTLIQSSFCLREGVVCCECFTISRGPAGSDNFQILSDCSVVPHLGIQDQQLNPAARGTIIITLGAAADLHVLHVLKLAFEVRDTEVRLQQIRLKCCCAVTGNKSPTVLTSTFQAKVGFPGNLHMVNRLSRKLPCVTFGQWEAPPTLVVLFMMPLCDVTKVVFTKQFSQIWLHFRYESRNKNRSLLYSCLPTYWNLS
jgi:hypothetical protein